MYPQLDSLEQRSLARGRTPDKQEIQVQGLRKNRLDNRSRSSSRCQRLFLLLVLVVLVLVLISGALLAASEQTRKEATFLSVLGARR